MKEKRKFYISIRKLAKSENDDKLEARAKNVQHDFCINNDERHQRINTVEPEICINIDEHVLSNKNDESHRCINKVEPEIRKQIDESDIKKEDLRISVKSAWNSFRLNLLFIKISY